MEVQVLLNAVDKVKEFCNAVHNCPCDMDLSRGRYTIDAKSIIGIYSLDLSKPLTLHVYDDQGVFDKSIIKDFIVE